MPTNALPGLRQIIAPRTCGGPSRALPLGSPEPLRQLAISPARGSLAIRDACRAEGIVASARRWKKAQKLAQTTAYLAGEKSTSPEDLSILDAYGGISNGKTGNLGLRERSWNETSSSG